MTNLTSDNIAPEEAGKILVDTIIQLNERIEVLEAQIQTLNEKHGLAVTTNNNNR
jgi:hypothetical protein